MAADSQWRNADAALRIGVLIQCVGLIWALAVTGETPLFAWLWEDSSLGGLGLAEATAQTVQRLLAGVLAVAALAVLAPRLRMAALAPFAVALVMAIAMWRIHEGFQPLRMSLTAPWQVQLASAFPLASGAARIGVPLALALFGAASSRAIAAPLLRWSVAVTFLAHGIEACSHNPKFIDMILITSRHYASYDVSQQWAEHALTAIGIVDVLLAVLVVTTRSPLVAAYMAFWGATTAAARLLVYGVAMGFSEFATRAPHFAGPLALAILWWGTRKNPALIAPDTPIEETHA